jgi:hypothetical protein
MATSLFDSVVVMVAVAEANGMAAVPTEEDAVPIAKEEGVVVTLAKPPL